MNLTDIDISVADLHIHSTYSDGKMSGEEIVRNAAEIGLKYISITDHDSVGVYRDKGEELYALAEDYGVILLPGIEFDSVFKGVEIHILGYGLDYNDYDLVQYLEKNHSQRISRMEEMISGVNRHFGKEHIKESEVFIQGRETLMKPHLIEILLEKGIFGNYPEAKNWINSNINVENSLVKPSSVDVVNMILKAGGNAVIAHPGYCIKDKELGLKGFDKMLDQLVSKGLLGIELFYEYSSLQNDEFSENYYRNLKEILMERIKRYGLIPTRGCDAHKLEEFINKNKRCRN